MKKQAAKDYIQFKFDLFLVESKVQSFILFSPSTPITDVTKDLDDTESFGLDHTFIQMGDIYRYQILHFFELDPT